MSDDKFKRGLEIRKEVLGAEYVERALANADEFSMPLQKMVTEHAWHDIWSRPGLSRRDRSLVNLAMIGALNRPHELKLHVAGAIRNGLSKDEIREVLLQVGVYAGMPAAIDCFRVAKETFAEMEKGK